MLDPAKYSPVKRKKKSGPGALVSGYQYTNPELKPAVEDFIRDVAVPYGPLFRAVPECRSDVAVFLGWASSILSGTAPFDWGRAHLCGVAAAAANLAPSVIFEEDVEMNGIPDSVKVLLMPEAEVLTEGAYIRIRDFQRRGGRLVAFKELAPALKADAMLPAFCSPRRKERKADVFESGFRAAVEELKKTVSDFASPRVKTDTPYLHAHARGEKAYDLLFAVNDRRGPGEYVGVFNTVFEKGLPLEGKVFLNRDAKAVYDLLKHRRMDCKVKDGTLEMPLSLDGAEGRLFLVCDRALAPLTASVKRVDGGVEVSVKSPDGDMMVPIRIDGVGGKPFYGVVKNGGWRHVFAEGPDKVNVVNLADGSVAQAIFESLLSHD